MNTNDKANLVVGMGGCGVIFILCVSICAGCYGCSHIDLSDGYRDGVVQKFSHKGLIFKTWEGELLLSQFGPVGKGGVGMRTFEFSVEDPEVAHKLEHLPSGTRVRLHYHQKAATWQPRGETSYFITRVEVVE